MWAFHVFQPTLPVRGATFRELKLKTYTFLFQPTLPVRGATLAVAVVIRIVAISTHAPRAGSDQTIRINMRLPGLFQPTLPVRGATPSIQHTERHQPDFNPRSPCGERQ